MKKPRVRKGFLQVAGAALALILLAYGGFRLWTLSVQKEMFRIQAASLGNSLRLTGDALSRLIGERHRMTQENTGLQKALSSEQDRNQLLGEEVANLSGAVNDLSGTVGVLQKLSKTDAELLKKYSKVYFLSDNYAPSELSTVSPQYLRNRSATEQLHAKVLPFFQNMLDAAYSASVTLQVVSAYRSFDRQASVKYGYTVLYGSGANKFSADQGYSEHQLGTTCDFTSPENGEAFLKFETTKAYAWLRDNAYRFGFILSYPKGNAYYQFEPWHWRFVGIALATKLQTEHKSFYDLTQREIDQYLVSIFD